MKELIWLGDSRKILKAFPRPAQNALGVDLLSVQCGRQARDFKPMTSIGVGVEEIRVWVESGTYRVIYVARFEEATYVLHAFQKKSQQTSRRDLILAKERLQQLLLDRRKKSR